MAKDPTARRASGDNSDYTSACGLVSPLNGALLRVAEAGVSVGGIEVPRGLAERAILLSDGERLWPVLEGIAWLRPHEDLRAGAVDCIIAGNEDAAVRLLLADQDRFAPTAPPSRDALDRLLADDPTRGGKGDLSLREAMQLLNYGAVGDYFAYRWLSPTYLSGLVLLGRAAVSQRTVVEYACGVGHYLRALEQLDFEVVGVDIVFSKLYLARRFLDVRGTLVCGDIEASPVVAASDAARTVFCHDAFYFFERKRAALEHLRGVAGSGGSVAIGHVHTRSDAHETGFSESLTDYRARLPTGTVLLDDADLTSAWYGMEPYPDAGATEEARAVAWLEGDERQESVDWLELARQNPSGLRQNPLLVDGRVDWPSTDWHAEYEGDAAAANLGPYHLTALAERPRMGMAQLAGGSTTALQASALASSPRELLRDRLLVNLPPRW